MSFIKELKRRNVIRVAVAYVIVAWLSLQVSDTLVPALHLPEWFHSGVALFLILGFPIALIFAWAYEMTPAGLKKEKDVDRSASITQVTGRKLDFAIITALVLALDQRFLFPLGSEHLV
jgi:adenylate cyclase